MSKVDRASTSVIIFGLFLQQTLSLITGLIIAHSIRASGFGIVSILRSLVTALVTLTPLGLDIALLKHIPRFGEDQLNLNIVIRRLRFVVLVVNLALVSTLGTSGHWIQTHLYRYGDFSQFLLITLIGVPFAADLAVMGAYYRAMNKPAVYALLTAYCQPIFRLIAVFFVIWSGLGLIGIVGLNSAVVLVSFLAMTCHLFFWQVDRRRGISTPAPNALGDNWRTVFVILGESSWMGLGLFVYGAMRFVDVLVLGLYVPAREVGAYGALSTMAQLIQIYPLASSQTLGPTVARLYQQNNIKGVHDELNAYISRASLVGGFVFGGVAAFGDELDVVFGHTFRFLPIISILMATGWLISAVLAPMGFSLSMTGRHRLEFGILCFGGAVLTALCFLLVPHWGQSGAATAVIIAFGIVNVARFLCVSRALGFTPGSIRDLFPPTLALALAELAKCAGLLALGRSLPSLVLSSVSYSATYLALSLFLLLGTRERSKVWRGIREISRPIFVNVRSALK